MDKPLLVVFLGFPGSGKTYFSKQLAAKLNAVTFNTDALRVSMFGSLERADEIRAHDRSRAYDDVFGAMNYATRQVLRSGYSVVYDAQQSKRHDRLSAERVAHESGAIPILVWIKTSRTVALKRGQEREVADDSNRYDAEKTAYLIDRFESVTDLPEQNENLIEISGEIPFDQQLASFMAQLGRYTTS